MKESIAAWTKALGVKASRSYAIDNIAHEGQGYTGSHPPASNTRNSTIVRSDYKPADNGAHLSILTMSRGGHGWPRFEGTSQQDVNSSPFGFSNNDIQAERVMWAFFKDKRRIKK